MKTTTSIYHLSLTQFWPNFKVRFLWQTIITTTKPTTTTITTTATTILGCDSNELNLVVVVAAVDPRNQPLMFG